jgi:hypothetical protein
MSGSNHRHPIVSVFGAGAPARASALYEEAMLLGRFLAEAGYVVATGGYGGVMEAASRGAREAGGHVIGVTCERIERYAGTRVNQWVSEEVRFAGLRERLYHLITLADALVAMPGGVGTLGEVAAAWNAFQTGELPGRPVLLVGRPWRRTFETFLAEMDGYIRPPDVDLLTYVADPAEAVAELGRRLAPAGTPSE